MKKLVIIGVLVVALLGLVNVSQAKEKTIGFSPNVWVTLEYIEPEEFIANGEKYWIDVSLSFSPENFSGATAELVGFKARGGQESEIEDLNFILIQLDVSREKVLLRGKVAINLNSPVFQGSTLGVPLFLIMEWDEDVRDRKMSWITIQLN